MYEQTISARFKCQNTTIIQVYAPTNEAVEEVKQDFHHQLHTAFIKRKTRNLIVIISYINAEVWGVIHLCKGFFHGTRCTLQLNVHAYRATKFLICHKLSR